MKSFIVFSNQFYNIVNTEIIELSTRDSAAKLIITSASLTSLFIKFILFISPLQIYIYYQMPYIPHLHFIECDQGASLP